MEFDLVRRHFKDLIFRVDIFQIFPQMPIIHKNWFDSFKN